MSNPKPVKIEDCTLTISIKDHYESVGMQFVRVDVEFATEKEARLKAKAVNAAKLKPEQATSDPWDDEEDEPEEERIHSLAYMSGICVHRHLCRGDFLSIMDEESSELNEFSVRLFDNNGFLKREFMDSDHHKGTGCFGREVNKGALFYLDTVSVEQEYRGQGLGTWMLEQFLKSKDIGQKDFVMLWPIPIEGREHMNDTQEKQAIKRLESFFHKAAFRRVGRTVFFAYANDPNHASRKLPASDDVDCDAHNDRSGFDNMTEEEMNPLRPRVARAQPNVAANLPLHHAIGASSGGGSIGGTSIDRFIVSYHATNPGGIHQQDDSGMTPLHVAAGLMNKLAVETLLKPEIAGAESDLNRRDNVNGKTPLEVLEASMRNNAEFKAVMLQRSNDPYPDEGLQCAYLLRKAMAEPVGTLEEYVKMKRFGCTCNKCTDGWLSPRMRYRLLCTSELIHDMVPDFISENKLAPMDPMTIASSVGLDYVPPRLWTKINSLFAYSYMAVVRGFQQACRDLTTTPTPAVVRALAGPDAHYYFQKDGRVEYALDYIEHFANDQSPLGDNEWDSLQDEQAEEGDEEALAYSQMPDCANDLNFELVRQQMGLPKKMGPYFDEMQRLFGV
ncbi:hypothetical protein EUX98_g5788 [Antrodiella citrinella]|uniref:N-acetyltransferase domain-containing protein n=1 Tax=Antrodiella citrinella TaxID=2447956 RepID=A0A4S4MQM3_9APHY|nr:hypothetical protein EUX98_g5788 [Antrodiella citrinella]